ncbi:MAG: Hsp20/alpha crystallin family protein [Bacteroidota bacterium]
MALLTRSDFLPTWSNLVNDFFSTGFNDWHNRHYSSTNTTLPAVNIKENGGSFVVEMAAPGMSKEDFKIHLDNDVLTISSQKEKDKENKEGERYTRREFSYLSFTRSFNLPETVESEKITAKYHDGILLLEIPKKEEAKQKPAKQIAIS